MNAVRVVIFAVVVIAAGEAQAANQIARITSNLVFTNYTFTLNADSKSVNLTSADTQAQTQTKVDAVFGASCITVTKTSPDVEGEGPQYRLSFEFVGKYATFVVPYSFTSYTNCTVATAQAGTGGTYNPTPPPEDPKDSEEEIGATEATLLELLGQLEALNATQGAQAARDAQQLFLLQALAQTMCLICGGLLWRTIILAKNQTRFW